MLRFLSIKHFAVIDRARVELEAGLNVLTGETGAGKSILVEAVGLLLGGRASAGLVRSGEDAAIVEALFEHDGEELLVRREMTSQGRSRAFVNGELVTAGALRDLSSRLIELHGQHEHHTLLDPATHVTVLDAFAALSGLRAAVSVAHERLAAATETLTRVQKAASDRASRQELAAFQLAELDRAAPVEREDDELAATRQVLVSAERLERLCAESYAALYESDAAILASLGGVWRRVSELASLDPQFQPYVEAREGIKAQLEDLAFFLRRYADGIDASPARLQQVEERLSLLERLKKRYGPTLSDVRAKRDALRVEVSDLEQHEDRLRAAERDRDEARDRYVGAAAALTAARRAAAPTFADRIQGELAELAMERTRFEVRFGPSLDEPSWTAAGVDALEFYVSPNPGEELRPLARIVSGGELSRIMLAIKVLTAVAREGGGDGERRPGSSAPGMIFDEVDAGIGGRVADAVGRRLRALGSAFQVVCITHLPQVAACADTHFLIEKHVEDGRTRTSVERLDRSGRVGELARMLGGQQITAGIVASAREMLATRSGEAGAPAGPHRTEDERRKRKGESETAREPGKRR
jgi:DNA repair protein RecN (Recombination protein N)